MEHALPAAGVTGCFVFLNAVGVGILASRCGRHAHVYALLPQGSRLCHGARDHRHRMDGPGTGRRTAMGLALIGDFLTPVLAGPDVDAEGTLLGYLLMLDAAALVLQRFRTSPRIAAAPG